MLTPRIRGLRPELVVRASKEAARIELGETDLLGKEEGIHLLDELSRVAAGQMPLSNHTDVLVVGSAPHRIASQNPCKVAGANGGPVDVVVRGRPDGLHSRQGDRC